MKSPKFTNWLIRAAVLGGITGLLLGLTGRIFAPFDVFAHFTPQFAVVLMSGCVAWVLRSYGIIILAVGAFVTLGAHPVIAWLGNGQPTSAKAALAQTALHGGKGTPLKIISLNSWHSHPNPDRIVSYLKSANADFVVLVEFGPDKIKLLKQLRKEYPYNAHCSNRWYCSVAILSRHPILARGSGGPRTTMPAHVWVSVQIDGRDLTIIGTHLHRPIDGMNRHRQQLIGLAKLAGNAEWPVLVVGDFNSTRWADSYSLFTKQSRLTPMPQYLPSWPAAFPQLAIDHIFHNNKVTLGHVETGTPLGSDHLPLIATLQLN